MCDDCRAHAATATEPAPCPGSPPWPGTEPAEPAAELADLIAEQAADDESARAPRHRREIPATDLDGRTTRRNGRHEQATGTTPRRGWRMLERQVDHRCSPRAWQDAAHQAIDDAAAAAVRSGGENRAGRASSPTVPLIIAGMGHPWGAAEAQYRPGDGLCAGCGDRKLDAITICGVCHCTRQDPRRWPQQAQEVKRAKRPKRAAKVKVKRAKVPA